MIHNSSVIHTSHNHIQIVPQCQLTQNQNFQKITNLPQKITNFQFQINHQETHIQPIQLMFVSSNVPLIQSNLSPNANFHHSTNLINPKNWYFRENSIWPKTLDHKISAQKHPASPENKAFPSFISPDLQFKPLTSAKYSKLQKLWIFIQIHQYDQISEKLKNRKSLWKASNVSAFSSIWTISKTFSTLTSSKFHIYGSHMTFSKILTNKNCQNIKMSQSNIFA